MTDAEDWITHVNARGYTYEINSKGETRWLRTCLKSSANQNHAPQCHRWELCYDENGFGYYNNGHLSYWETDDSVWTELKDQSGHKYFANNLTGESVWERPTAVEVEEVEAAAAAAENPIADKETSDHDDSKTNSGDDETSLFSSLVSRTTQFLVEQRENTAKLLAPPQPQVKAQVFSPMKQKAAPQAPKPASARGLKASVRAKVPAAALGRRERAPSPPAIPILKAKSGDYLQEQTKSEKENDSMSDREDPEFDPERFKPAVDYTNQVAATCNVRGSAPKPPQNQNLPPPPSVTNPAAQRQGHSQAHDEGAATVADPHQLAVERFLAGDASVEAFLDSFQGVPVSASNDRELKPAGKDASEVKGELDEYFK